MSFFFFFRRLALALSLVTLVISSALPSTPPPATRSPRPVTVTTTSSTGVHEGTSTLGVSTTSSSGGGSSTSELHGLSLSEFRDMTDPRIDRMHEEDLETIWENIVNQDKIFDGPDGGGGAGGHQANYQLINSSTVTHPPSPALQARRDSPHSYQLASGPLGGSNIDMMTRIFHELFVHRRSDDFDVQLKAKSREGIIERLSHYTLETQSQEFYARSANGTIIKGINVIGVIPGRNRGKPGDGIVLIGAHYDTVPTSPGVDANGSGMVALLEAARLLSPRMGHFNNTIMLVAFDHKEKGVLGSLAFVNNYLIPNELVNRKAKFLGAYVLDMVLNYDPHPRSQVFPLDILAGVPESALWLRRNMNAGDFVSVWSRRVHDWPLWHQFQSSWERLGGGTNTSSPHPKVFQLDPPIPRNPLLLSQIRYRAFFRSDHASFWAHRNRAYSEPLSAVLLTDMGPWRGKQRGCYHEFCDDSRLLTNENLSFLKRITDSVAAAVARIAE